MSKSSYTYENAKRLVTIAKLDNLSQFELEISDESTITLPLAGFSSTMISGI